MWQIFTEKIPYLDMNILFIIFRNVTQGLRPDMNDIPSEVPKSQIEIISSCWDDDQNKRPLFPEVKEMMRSALDEFYFQIKPEKSIVVNKRILGIAWLENTIYVVRIGSRKILAYSDSKPFELMDDAIIRITAMSCPIDITSNHNCQSLFVSDRGNSCLWKIQTSNGDISKHVMDGKLGTLSSTRSDKLLVLLKREVWNLDIYSVTDASCLKTISFPGQIRKPMHAIELSNKNFIVSSRQSEEKMEACSQHKENLVISEMTEKGNIISQLVYPLLGSINSTFFDFPGYLSLDERHNIFCTDPISNKLIMLDSQLTNSQDLLKYETDHITNPTRLCYVPNKQQLIVGQMVHGPWRIVYILFMSKWIIRQISKMSNTNCEIMKVNTMCDADVLGEWLHPRGCNCVHWPWRENCGDQVSSWGRLQSKTTQYWPRCPPRCDVELKTFDCRWIFFKFFNIFPLLEHVLWDKLPIYWKCIVLWNLIITLL